MATTSHGKFVWYELMTPDIEGAAKFYHAVVGLDSFDPNMPGAPYTMLRAPGGTVIGGIAPLPVEHPAPPHWIGYIYVDDLAAAVRHVGVAGGIIRRPAAEIPGVGHFAVAADPQGATFILFKPDPEPTNPQPPASEGTPGTIGWHELHAADETTAFAFYETLFGWKEARSDDLGPLGTYRTFTTNGGMGGLMTKVSPSNPHWKYYFNVPDIDAAIAGIASAGGDMDAGWPREIPGGNWIVMAQDPHGAHFALVGPRPA
jgi:predicted enzyme related to lactoylglutathione lyase